MNSVKVEIDIIQDEVNKILRNRLCPLVLGCMALAAGEVNWRFRSEL